MHIREVAEPGREWDAFVEARPASQLGHAAGWAQVVREAYGLTSHYLEARDPGGEIAGVLPLVALRDLGGKLELVSMPFLDSGGILARDPETERVLLEAALEKSRELGARVVELRQAVSGARPAAAQHRVDLFLALEESEEAQWRALRAKVRNQTRKAEKEGLTIAPRDSVGLLDGFYRPFRHNMRDLGSPVHGRSFFAAAAVVFGERLRFIVTQRDKRPVGGLVAIDFAGAVTVPWASTLRAERRNCPNNQIYWEALRWAIECGAQEFDFGRSPLDSGTYRFKVGWGAQERALAWERRTPAGELLEWRPTGDSDALRRLSAIWSRLPVALTALIGPRIRRRISS